MKSSMYSSRLDGVMRLSRLFFLKMWAKSSALTASPATVTTVWAWTLGRARQRQRHSPDRADRIAVEGQLWRIVAN